MGITFDFNEEEFIRNAMETVVGNIRDIVSTMPCPTHGRYVTVVEKNDGSDSPWALDNICCEAQKDRVLEAIGATLSE